MSNRLEGYKVGSSLQTVTTPLFSSSGLYKALSLCKYILFSGFMALNIAAKILKILI